MTDHFRFLETQGLSGAEVRTAIYFSAAYQSVMRTSLRDPTNRSPKQIVVPDRALAEYLHDLFPGSRIEKFEVGLREEVRQKAGRPRKHKANKDRVADWRRRKAEEKKVEVLNDLATLSAQNADGLESCPPGGARHCNDISKMPYY
jgi:hypothetical protein